MFKKLFGFGKKKKEEIQEESVEEIQVEEDGNSELEEAQNDSDDLKEEIEELIYEIKEEVERNSGKSRDLRSFFLFCLALGVPLSSRVNISTLVKGLLITIG